jgi:hypothetical protein
MAGYQLYRHRAAVLANPKLNFAGLCVVTAATLVAVLYAMVD